jgi:hemolysin activation/secretion protein
MLRAFCVALLVGGAGSATAQIVPGSPAGLLIDQGRIDRLPSQTPPPMVQPSTAVPDHVTTVDKGVGDRAVVIRGVRFDGSEVPERVGDAARPFLGRPASAEALGQLANAMSTAYGKSAVALYTLAIPAQSFAEGIVHVRVAEGFVEQAIVTGDVSHSSVKLVRQYAGTLAAERPLRRASLQRCLSLIRDIPGLTVDVQLLRGTRSGAVKLLLVLKQKTHAVSLSFDNRTQEGLAQGEFNAMGKLYGALRPGDETDLNLASAANFRNYGYAGLTHSTPIGHNGTRAAVSIAHLGTRARHTHLKGNADILSFSISHPLIRSYTRNLLLSLSVDGVNSNNAVLGSLVSRERTRAARAAASFTDAGAKHSLAASLTVSRGLDIANADTDLTFADPRFVKVNGRVSLDRALGKRFVARLAGAGQWADDALPAVERFIVGGADFGRAYPVALLAGDRGAAGSAELAWRPSLPKMFEQSEFYIFGDKATVHYLERGPSPAADYDIASAGAGVRVAWLQKAQIDLEAAKRIERPYPGYEKGWQLNVAWRLSLGR